MHHGAGLWRTSRLHIVTKCPCDRGQHVPGCRRRSQAARAAQRGVVILPGLGNNTKDYSVIAEDLKQRGLKVDIAKVSRFDWFRNAAGLLDINYWRGTLEPRPTVDWYLTRVHDAVQSMQEQLGTGSPVTLLAHSAGGWLARVYLLGFGTQGIDRLVTLGSPHQPPPKEGVTFTIDQTRGILTYVENNCPGRFHDEIEYVTVGGKYLQGAKLRQQGASLSQKVVGLGYLQVCGEADVWGDGVVPLPSAHLEGARQITLDGVYHSPLGSVAAVEGDKPGRPWYGSSEIVDQWIDSILVDASELEDTKQELGKLASTTVAQ